VFLRFSDLSAPLLEFHPTRQLFGAIKARGLYYQTLADVPSWKKDLAVRQYAGEATIEPPLMEHLVASLYQYFGEQTAIPRAISASFWIIGGLFLFLLAKNLTESIPAATAGLSFFLLMPYAVTASRAFQPDPLMIMLLLVFWWSIENWGRNTNWQWTFIAGLSGGMAIFVKFPAVFFVAGSALGVIFSHLGLIKSIKKPQTWLLALLGILPPGLYFYYGTIMDGFLGQQFGSRIYPELWTSPYFYLRWFLKLENVASVPWITLGILGWLLFSSKPVKIFLGSMWAAYLLFGMTFAHHISSHDYYSLPLLPILALCLAQLSRGLLPVLKTEPHIDQPHKLSHVMTFSKPVIIFTLIAAMLLVTLDQYVQRSNNDFQSQADFWTKIGEAIGHQPGVLALTSDYGYPLAYYGWQNSSPWPPKADIESFDETFMTLTRNKAYFLITDFVEYDRQADLRKLLVRRYPILVQSRYFIVFDLAHPKR